MMILSSLLILFSGLATSAWVVQVVVAVVSAAFSYNQQRKMKKKAERAQDARAGFIENVKGESRSLPICYGRTTVGGTLVDVKVRHDYSYVATSGTGIQTWTIGSKLNQSQNPKKSRNEFLIAQYAFCQDGINSVKHVDVEDSDYNDEQFRRDKNGWGHRIVTHTQGGVADPLASANFLPASNKFTGVCYGTGAFYLNRDDPQYYGIPQLQIYVEGLKVAFVTLNSGVYSYDRSGTRTYTTNPAWILLDYLTADYGANLPVSALNLKSFYDAAQVCQEGVNTALGLGAITRQGKVWRGSNAGSLTSGSGNPYFSFTGTNEILDSYGNVSNVQSLGGGRFHTATNAASISDDSEFTFDFSNVYYDTASQELRLDLSDVTAQGSATVPSTADEVILGDVSSFWQDQVTNSLGLPRYECNLTIDPSAPVRDNIDQILFTMGNADMVYSEGQYKLNLLYPADNTELQNIAANTLVVTDDLLKNSEIKITFPSNASKLNQCTVKYSNEQDNFKSTSAVWPETGSSVHLAYLAQDNNIVLNTSITVDGITDPYHATARAEQTVRESRRAIVYEFELFSEAYSLEPGDYIQFNSVVNNLTSADDVALVRSVELTTDMTIKVEAIKVNADDLAWNISDEELSPEPPYINFESLAPVLTNAVIAEADLNNDTIYGYRIINSDMSIFLRWAEPDDPSLFEMYEIEAQLGTQTEEGWFQIGTTRNEHFTFVPGRPDDDVYFRIRIKSTNGTRSPYSNVLGPLSVTYKTPADEEIESIYYVQLEDGSILQLEDGSFVLKETVGDLGLELDSTKTTVTTLESDVTTLSSTVNDPVTGVVASANLVSGLETRVIATENDIVGLEAEYFVDVDVNGHIAGISLYNTGTTSSFTVQASEFKVVAPGASSTEAAPFSVDTSGNITMNSNVEINGNLLVDGSISQTQLGNDSVGSDEIINGSVTANELEISANPGGSGERMFFNGTDNRIEIFDASNVLRVALGDLTGV